MSPGTNRTGIELFCLTQKEKTNEKWLLIQFAKPLLHRLPEKYVNYFAFIS